MSLLQIGEFAKKLPLDFQESTSNQIPWKAIQSMRDKFAHDYVEMDDEVIWATVDKDIPKLKVFCTRAIEGKELLQIYDGTVPDKTKSDGLVGRVAEARVGAEGLEQNVTTIASHLPPVDGRENDTPHSHA